MRHFPGDDVVDRIGPSTTMGIDNTLGPPCGARGVVQSKRIPFVIRQRIGEIWIAFRQQCLIGKRADFLPAKTFAVFDVDEPTDHGLIG